MRNLTYYNVAFPAEDAAAFSACSASREVEMGNLEVAARSRRSWRLLTLSASPEGAARTAEARRTLLTREVESFMIEIWKLEESI
jgi:hypothetical protein